MKLLQSTVSCRLQCPAEATRRAGCITGGSRLVSAVDSSSSSKPGELELMSEAFGGCQRRRRGRKGTEIKEWARGVFIARRPNCYFVIAARECRSLTATRRRRGEHAPLHSS